MKIEVESDDTSQPVHLGETRTGMLYRYAFCPAHRQRETYVYVLATVDTNGRRIFVDLEDGGWYWGDKGELRLLGQAELILGRKQ